MMTTPRLVSLTALAASLFIVILTITQASGTPNEHVASLACFDTVEQTGCRPAGGVTQASFLLP